MKNTLEDIDERSKSEATDVRPNCKNINRCGETGSGGPPPAINDLSVIPIQLFVQIDINMPTVKC